jgi:hypothetical protein
MSILKTIISKPTPTAPKGILYGPPGIGKTTFGGSAPNSLIIDCENGAGTIPCQRTPYLDRWSEIESWLLAIESENHSHQVVAIDSLDWMVRRIEESVSGGADKLTQTLNKSHGGYGNGKQVMRNYIYSRLLPMLDRITARGIAVVLLAHAKRTEITDIDGIVTEKVAPDLPEEYLNTFVEWSDFVCLARMNPEGQRVIVAQETGSCLAKNRYGMPAIIPFSWSDFTDAISSGISRNFEKKEG